MQGQRERGDAAELRERPGPRTCSGHKRDGENGRPGRAGRDSGPTAPPRPGLLTRDCVGPGGGLALGTGSRRPPEKTSCAKAPTVLSERPVALLLEESKQMQMNEKTPKFMDWKTLHQGTVLPIVTHGVGHPVRVKRVKSVSSVETDRLSLKLIWYCTGSRITQQARKIGTKLEDSRFLILRLTKRNRNQDGAVWAQDGPTGHGRRAESLRSTDFP